MALERESPPPRRRIISQGNFLISFHERIARDCFDFDGIKKRESPQSIPMTLSFISGKNLDKRGRRVQRVPVQQAMRVVIFSG